MYWDMSEMRKARASHTKVRTGCITCKIRHKKCDEALPACRNCTDSGRKCDGYAQAPDKRTRAWRKAEKSNSSNNQMGIAAHKQNDTMSGPVRNLPIGLVDPGQVGLNSNERWHVHFFRNCTAHQCMGYFEDPFWGQLVHQMCNLHPAVRHAVIALSARHCQFEAVQTKLIEDRESLLALSHSSKAIACLRDNLVRGQSDCSHKETVLVACILLTMLALLQEDIFAARCHLLSGSRLFKEWVAVDSEKGPDGQTLKQAFAHVHMHFSTCENPKVFVEDRPSTSPDIAGIGKIISPGIDEFERDKLYITVVERQVLRRHPDRGFSIGPASSPIGRGEITVLSKLRLWRSQLKYFLASGNLRQRHCDMLDLLELWSLVFRIKLAVASLPQPTELLFDGYLTYFQRVVSLAKTLLRAGQETVPSPESHIKMSVITALVWCGVKCRDWFLRCEIVSLLGSFEVQESCISAMTVILDRLIEIESNAVKSGHVIPQDARVDSLKVELPADSQIHIWYCRPGCRLDRKKEHDIWESDTLSY